MGRLTITKALILKTIETEDLSPGNWIEVYESDYDDTNNTCQVCAVGGVLMNALNVTNPYDCGQERLVYDVGDFITRTDHESSFDCVTNPTGALKAEAWMVALSAKFETLSEAHGMSTVRKKLAEWVTKYFPDRFTVDINGYEPLSKPKKKKKRSKRG